MRPEPISIGSLTQQRILTNQFSSRANGTMRCFFPKKIGMRESLREGMATPLEECDEELAW